MTALEANQVESETEVPRLIGAFVACLVIAYLGVILRLISRRLNKTDLKADDWLLVTSLAFTTAFIGLNLGLTRDGLGRHANHITNAKVYALGVMILEVLYSMSIFLIKLSWLFLLHRIFPGRRLLRLTWAIGSVVTAYTIVQIVFVILHCIPVRALWDPQVPAHCINLDDVFITCGSLNIGSDIAILCLPMPDLWKLKVSTRQKVQLTLMFLLGSLVCIVSIIRVPKLVEISQTDPGWSIVSSAEWSVAECSVATLSACLPTMRPLYNWVFRREGRASTIEESHSGRIYPLGSGWHKQSVMLQGLESRTLGSGVKDNDTWPLNRATSDSVARPYVALEMGSMHAEGAVKSRGISA